MAKYGVYLWREHCLKVTGVSDKWSKKREIGSVDGRVAIVKLSPR